MLQSCHASLCLILYSILIPLVFSIFVLFLQVHLIGLDIFTGKRYEDVCPASHNMNVPNVKRQEYQVCNSKSARF
jgi:hypothetical protein